jgi:hypothetical protein
MSLKTSLASPVNVWQAMGRIYDGRAFSMPALNKLRVGVYPYDSWRDLRWRAVDQADGDARDGPADELSQPFHELHL